ncbi:MAG: hypothetical protein N5P05_002028 [Chroococcopsis gigantea SAG 12.99]|jgi:hypothetical protein|nr:hypothetical protein [Chlorogloea purpurea SAG 13.99]MDV3000422.1 hypothetical protein [Chroococcopsis gigantea SAG 12.99]
MNLDILPKTHAENLLTHTETDMWVDEAIWGHRLYDEQTPWLTMLEFLGIVQGELEADRAFIEERYNQLRYSSYTRLYLRNILFNNPFLEEVNNQFSGDEERWREWLRLMGENCGGIDDPDFSYLRERFRSFDDFAKVVRFLQSNSIEGDSNKRWSSKFVFPYGVHCLYEDLKVSNKDSYSNDRRFFARTGELLYLMISRTGNKFNILEYLKKMGIVGEGNCSKWDKLVATLQHDSENQPRDKNSNPPYLPYKQLDEFESLAKDWLNLLGCNLPGYDCLPHLVTITGLHLVIYLLKRAYAVLNNDDDSRFNSENLLDNGVIFILEIVGPKKTTVRNLSADNFACNTNITQQAIEHYVRRLSRLPEWQSCYDYPDSRQRAVEIIQREIYYKGEDIKGNSPDELLDEICQQALIRHKQHMGKFHQAWLKEIGLASNRGSRRNRYVPSDSLLKTLVLCCVPQRMEFQEFLQILSQKYGLIIGEKQAKEIIDRNEADQEAFADNGERLEQRLASLGLLKRLSDACAYVLNPYAVEGN